MWARILTQHRRLLGASEPLLTVLSPPTVLPHPITTPVQLVVTSVGRLLVPHPLTKLVHLPTSDLQSLTVVPKLVLESDLAEVLLEFELLPPRAVLPLDALEAEELLGVKMQTVTTELFPELHSTPIEQLVVPPVPNMEESSKQLMANFPLRRVPIQPLHVAVLALYIPTQNASESLSLTPFPVDLGPGSRSVRLAAGYEQVLYPVPVVLPVVRLVVLREVPVLRLPCMILMLLMTSVIMATLIVI